MAGGKLFSCGSPISDILCSDGQENDLTLQSRNYMPRYQQNNTDNNLITSDTLLVHDRLRSYSFTQLRNYPFK